MTRVSQKCMTHWYAHFLQKSIKENEKKFVAMHKSRNTRALSTRLLRALNTSKFNATGGATRARQGTLLSNNKIGWCSVIFSAKLVISNFVFIIITQYFFLN